MSEITVVQAKSKRDSRIELLRLLACFSVLVLHFKPGTFVEGQRILSRTFITCICTDAVGTFLLISGLFFFNNQSYGKKILAYLNTIFLPTLIYTVFIAVGYPLITGTELNMGSVLKEFAITFTTWNPVIHNTRHLWYMFLYGMIVAAYPLLKGIKEKISDSRMFEIAFFAFVFVLFAINDLSNNRILRSEMIPVTVFIPGCLLVIAGSLLYGERHSFNGKLWVTALSLAVFLLVNTVRSIYMRNMLNADSSASHMYGWYTSAGFICAVSLVIFGLSLKPFFSNFINRLASYTMGIYILHPWVSEIISVLGLKMWVISTFLNGKETFAQYMKFTIIYCSIVFVICAIIVMSIKSLLTLLKKHNP